MLYILPLNVSLPFIEPFQVQVCTVTPVSCHLDSLLITLTFRSHASPLTSFPPFPGKEEKAFATMGEAVWVGRSAICKIILDIVSAWDGYKNTLCFLPLSSLQSRRKHRQMTHHDRAMREMMKDVQAMCHGLVGKWTNSCACVESRGG